MTVEWSNLEKDYMNKVSATFRSRLEKHMAAEERHYEDVTLRTVLHSHKWCAREFRGTFCSCPFLRTWSASGIDRQI